MNPYDHNNYRETFNPYQTPMAETHDDYDEQGDLLDTPNRLSVADGIGWVGASWQIFKVRPLLWIGVLFIYAIIMTILSIIPGVGPLITGILGVMFMAGFAYLAYGIDVGEDVGFGDLFIGLNQAFKPLLMLWVFQFLAMLVALIPMFISVFMLSGAPNEFESFSPLMILAILVSALFVIPVAMATVFAPILVLFHELPALDALHLSFKACLRNILPMLLFSIVMTLVAFVAMIPFGLGMLVVAPMGMISIYVMYRDILIG